MSHPAPRPKSCLARRAAPSLAVLTAASVLAACGGGGTGAEPAPAPSNSISVEEVPDYYPAEYQELLDASREEGGVIEIYSNTDQENWAPVFRDFQTKYPWVETINANNLDSDEVFQRVLSEQVSRPGPYRGSSVGKSTSVWSVPVAA